MDEGTAQVVNIDRTYTINGVSVPFPAKAYPTQITMMHKILRGLDKKQNCLLESPTGSGKTLALLCSCLAWQKHEKEKLQKEKALEIKQQLEQLSVIEQGIESEMPSMQEKTVQANALKNKNMDMNLSPVNSEQPECKDTEKTSAGGDDCDFQTSKKRFRTPNGALPNMKRQRISQAISQTDAANAENTPEAPNWRMEIAGNAELPIEEKSGFNSEMKNKTSPREFDKKDTGKTDKRVPRIFFGTRTHKQIAQIVRELKKTAFKTVRMTILSSRDHGCIHPEVSKMKDKNEECRRHIKGVDGKTCRFHGNVSMLCRQDSRERYKLNSAWDIEDLIQAGKKSKACPYFAAREMMNDADIIFCPYNYLVSPRIRSQMGVSLKDEIVVLDEAHNIEDSARDAASVAITSTQLQDVMEELNKLIYFNIMKDSHETMHLLCSKIFHWLESLSDVLTSTGFETACKILTGAEMSERMKLLDVTASTFSLYKREHSKIVSAEYDPDYRSDIDAPKLSSKALDVLGCLVITLEKVVDEKHKYSDDFKIAVSRKACKTRRPHDLVGGWKTAKSRGSEKSWEYSLNFWCLNPAVIFSAIGNEASCIILTSGTLSPLNSFSSELGVSFPIQLEANHVIQDSQVWVGALTVGPDNQKIIANYQSSETFSFQDGVGRVVLQICQIIPHGVLCFFPSYGMLDKLKKRWIAVGLWKELANTKIIFVEPRGSDRSELDDVMGEFYRYAQEESTDDDRCSVNGALLLAVCRGKVSEGLDFSDNNARAVITIGIPFPDFKDTQVDLKRKYNNDHFRERGLLTGSEWYDIQAFRALNQALGRCIRHRKDWGAILLVDERFGRSKKYKNGLSKWVRNRCATYNVFNNCITSLNEFAEARRLNPCPDRQETPFVHGLPKTPASNVTASLHGKTSCCTTRKSDVNSTPLLRKDVCETRNLERQLKSELEDSFTGNNACCKEQKIDEALKLEKTTEIGLDTRIGVGTNLIPASSIQQWAESNQYRRLGEGIVKNTCNGTGRFDCALSASVLDKPNMAVKTEIEDKNTGSTNVVEPRDFSKPVTTRYNSFNNLMKPVFECRKSMGTSSRSGRAKLFRNATQCVSHVTKKENCSFNFKTETSIRDSEIESLSQNENFLRTACEMSSIDDVALKGSFDDITSKKNESIVKSMDVRSTSPNLFSDPNNEDDVDGGDVQPIDAQKFVAEDSVLETKLRVRDERGRAASVCEALEIENPSKLREGESEGKESVNDNRLQCGAINDSSNKGHTQRQESFNLVDRSMQNREDVEQTLENCNFDDVIQKSVTQSALNNSYMTENIVETRDIDGCIADNIKSRRKRKSSRTRSNLRMTVARKNLQSTNSVKEDLIENNGEKYNRDVTCSACHSVFLKRGKIRHSKVKLNLPNLGDCSRKESDVIEVPYGKLRNLKLRQQIHDCRCKSVSNGFKCNAVFSEEESLVYIPLTCDTCPKEGNSNSNLAGFRLIKLDQKVSSESDYDSLLLPAAVSITLADE